MGELGFTQRSLCGHPGLLYNWVLSSAPSVSLPVSHPQVASGICKMPRLVLDAWEIQPDDGGKKEPHRAVGGRS